MDVSKFSVHSQASRIKAGSFTLMLWFLLAAAGGVTLETIVTAANLSTGPLSPEQESATFHFADEQLMIELVAEEPDVVSPVAVAWDADGRMFVAEMSDYPNGTNGVRARYYLSP